MFKIPWVRLFMHREKNPLPYMSLPQVLFTTGVPVMGGNFSLLPLLFPIFDILHVQLIWLFRYRWTAAYQNSFYSVIGLPMKRTAYYPVTLVPLAPRLAQNIWVLFYCNPQGGWGWWGGQSFLSIPCVSALAVTCQNCFPNFTDYYWQFCSILCSKLGVFIILFFAVVYYSLSDIEPL